ncbi:MAG: tyrosine-type recombinase/integrase [Candidatus Woesearchaeota archaeon]|nr:tyrosine-type recombinase/integrase [Candidatus Woesearchaeota archaeon]
MDIPELIRKIGLRRGLSIRTINTYRQCVKLFFRQCSKDPKEVKKSDIEGYLDRLIEKGKAGNTVNVYLNALKFFYNEILHKRLLLNMRFSKTPKEMPVVLTKEETKRLIEAIENPKHRLMVKLLYSAGLRVSELVNLKPEHFEFSKNYGWVRRGKGNKDRLFIVAEKLKEELMSHITNECPCQHSWLFEGKNGHITITTLQKIIKTAAKKARIEKNVHPHTLRHSFATHLIENGYDVASVQSLLGHGSAATTMVYVHMASPRMINVTSPIEGLWASGMQ